MTEWPDQLDLVGVGTLDPVPFADVPPTILNRTHLFLDTDAEPVILPRRAFPEEGTIEDLAKRIEGIPKSAPPRARRTPGARDASSSSKGRASPLPAVPRDCISTASPIRSSGSFAKIFVPSRPSPSRCTSPIIRNTRSVPTFS